jgi:hypothetical protein
MSGRSHPTQSTNQPISQPTKSRLEDARLREKVKMNYVKIGATRWKVTDIDIGT